MDGGGVSSDISRSVRVLIEGQPSAAGVFSATPFEPQLSDDSPPRSSLEGGGSASLDAAAASCSERVDSGGTAAEGPERRLTLLALRLAILEKAASGLGALGFIWATVVLLGGFAITLGKDDFWSVTIILLIEGARIFSRSHELEWQHQATWSLSAAGRSSFRLVARSFRFVFGLDGRGGSTKNMDASSSRWSWRLKSWGFLSRHVGRAFYWLQLASATACITLSAVRLVRQDFGEAEDARTNRRSALDIFYGLALADALLFLAEKAVWEWEVSHGRLLECVASECHLAGAPGLLAIRRFFYDAYSRCVDGSIFDGLRTDLVSFAEELLVEGSHDEQRIGVGILVNVAGSPRLGDAALHRVGTSAAVMERLVEMLSWKGAAEAGARASAALVVSKLASKKRNALRVAGVPGAIESVSSLLYAADEECNLLGLLIIKRLAQDHDNCSKIGNARCRGSKPDSRIIDFSSIGAAGAPSTVITQSRAKAVKRSLQVIRMLADTTGSTGKQLRREVAEIVFTVSNIRAVLQHAASHLKLQQLGAEVLTRLAMDEDAREKIGGTGSVISLLLAMFFRQGITDEGDAVRVEAGEALAMLALDSPHNCEHILNVAPAVVDRLVEALSDNAVGVGAARILTNLCAYTGGERFPEVRAVTSGAATVDLVNRLVHVLARYSSPSIKVPRIRRFTVELLIGMLRMDSSFAELMAAAGVGRELRRVAETTSELECFHVFSGSAGVSRHAVSLCALVSEARELMDMDFRSQ
ncbi:hypothetical protein VPH35_088854 [Triticum aestivum]|uniref:Uncharacterized protein n=2 Tax=Triticinae TaxID=1648030 RepID=A0A3B6LI22_WHEAT